MPGDAAAGPRYPDDVPVAVEPIRSAAPPAQGAQVPHDISAEQIRVQRRVVARPGAAGDLAGIVDRPRIAAGAPQSAQVAHDPIGINEPMRLPVAEISGPDRHTPVVDPITVAVGSAECPQIGQSAIAVNESMHHRAPIGR